MNIVDIHAHPLLDRLYTAQDSREPYSILPGLFGNSLSFDALTKGRVGVVVSSMYPFWCPTRRSAYLDRCHDIIKLVESYLTEHHERATLVTDSDGVERALAQGKIAFIHAVEGGHVLEGRSENLERLYDWGVRSLTLTHFVNNDIAASALDPRRKFTGRSGLTTLGRQVVTKMNDLGMVIDLAHSSERAFWQALELTKHPLIVSHTGVRHYVPWEICLSDEQIRAIAQNGGLVGIILSSLWLGRFCLVADIGDLVKNILYVCNLVGVDHVGIGSDFNGTPPIRGVRTAGDLPCIWTCLSKAGLSDDDVARVMGGNFLRLFRQVMEA
jgi:membrane dipeptidase